MLRLFASLLLLAAVPLAAQQPSTADDFSRLEAEMLQMPKDTFSSSVRYGGTAKVRFRNLGTVNTSHDWDFTDKNKEMTRTYDDGTVGKDTRTTTDGTDLPDDYTTNNWSYVNANQVTADESGIAFHIYQSQQSGASVSKETGAGGGVDFEYGHQMGQFGFVDVGELPKWTWGVSAGFGLSDVNVKTSSSVKANLYVLTDTYSLLGAAVPNDGDSDNGVEYSAPSTSSTTVTNADGTTTTFSADTTTPLGNRPETHDEKWLENAANISGTWQVKGAYFLVRSGAWLRWQPKEYLAFRFSIGGTAGWLGLQFRWDERLSIDDTNIVLSAVDETKNKGYGLLGFYTGLDSELWFTRRTGMFGSATYDYFTKSVSLTGEDGRVADVDVSSGLVLRMGIITKF